MRAITGMRRMHGQIGHMGRLAGTAALAAGLVGVSTAPHARAGAVPAPASLQLQASAPAAATRALAAYGRLPLRFEENRGQAAADVRFLSRGVGYTVLLTADEAVLALTPPHSLLSISRAREGREGGLLGVGLTQCHSNHGRQNVMMSRSVAP